MRSSGPARSWINRMEKVRGRSADIEHSRLWWIESWRIQEWGWERERERERERESTDRQKEESRKKGATWVWNSFMGEIPEGRMNLKNGNNNATAWAFLTKWFTLFSFSCSSLFWHLLSFVLELSYSAYPIFFVVSEPTRRRCLYRSVICREFVNMQLFS